MESGGFYIRFLKANLLKLIDFSDFILSGGQVVASSNLAVPTIKPQENQGVTERKLDVKLDVKIKCGKNDVKFAPYS
jgi:hypothetical protein